MVEQTLTEAGLAPTGWKGISCMGGGGYDVCLLFKQGRQYPLRQLLVCQTVETAVGIDKLKPSGFRSVTFYAV